MRLSLLSSDCLEYPFGYSMEFVFGLIEHRGSSDPLCSIGLCLVAVVYLLVVDLWRASVGIPMVVGT